MPGPGTEGSGQGVQLAHPDYKVNPRPRYPMIARRNGYEGFVVLKVLVLQNGKVGKTELEKSSGYDMLDNTALGAVKKWIFIPGMKDGVPIPSWVKVPIKFQLNNG